MNGYSYDVIFPSDYMIKKMADEGLLAEINFDNMPNYNEYIDEKYKGMAYDKKNLYSVPYIGGTVCIAYNPEYVTAEEASSWNVLWDAKHSKNIFMLQSRLLSNRSLWFLRIRLMMQKKRGRTKKVISL